MQWIAPSEKDALTDTLEKRLWDSADQFRANSSLKAQEYSGPILGIIFLRFAEVRFIAQRATLEKASASSRRGSKVDDPAAYHAEGILYLAPNARFEHLLTLPEAADIMSHQTGWFCGTGCLRVRPNPQAVNGWYLFNYLGQDDVVGLIQGRAQGVTMPNPNTGILLSVPVRLPPRQLQDDFARLKFPMAEAHEALTTKIETLRQRRDMLLPRLLSGQVDLDTN